MEDVKVLKEKQSILEKEIENKNKYLELHVIQHVAQSNEESIVQPMFQVSLKELEILGLRNPNKNMEDAKVLK